MTRGLTEGAPKSAAMGVNDILEPNILWLGNTEAHNIIRASTLKHYEDIQL